MGTRTMTFVDDTRPTPASGDHPAQDRRTLPTTIFYPAVAATGSTSRAATTNAPTSDVVTTTSLATPDDGATAAVPDASPDVADGPYPLIVFGHGFAANPEIYRRLLTHWASAGFVVAAPTFPLSSSAAPGGPDAGDVASQPGDMSFVLDQVLAASKGNAGPLAGLVDADHVGAAGHSYGAITTVGLVGHECCRDPRFSAVIVMAGAMAPIGTGDYDLTDAPPLLVVHGTDDTLIPYGEGVAIFNAAHGPKGLVTLGGGSHMAAAALDGTTAGLVETVTTDFFDGYLRGDRSALERLAHDADDVDDDVATVQFASEKGSTVTVPVPEKPERDLHATATPTEDLRDGQTITVTWSGFTPGKVVNLLQCSAKNAALNNQSACDFTQAKLLQADPTGEGSLEMQVITGKVGTGMCDAQNQGCFIVVNDASSPDPAAMVKIPITFAG